MKKTIYIILLASLVGACSNKENAVPSQAEMSAARAKLAFTCTHEADHLPPLDPEVDQLFKYGLYLEKLDGPKDFDAAARYYRIAAAYGHYKANHNLQLLVSQGSAKSPDAPNETIDLAEQLIKANIPGGYYDMGHYLELGYGVRRNEDTARRFLRKAADMGNPEAQAYVGDLLEPLDKAPEIARQMRQCATDQGYGDAASTLGIDLKTDKLYLEALKAFQKGVEAGDTQSALALEGGFSPPSGGDIGRPPGDQLYYLALPVDAERARRYKLIGDFIDDNDGRNPKVPDIDKIVPLPPAKLPPWDGTFQWQKEQDAAVPPQKPSDELINRLSHEKNLDPATGLPLPQQPQHTSQADSAPVLEANLPLGTTSRSGAACPQRGVWCADIPAGKVADKRWSLGKGDIFPALTVYHPRVFAWLDNLLPIRKETVAVTWKLMAYLDQA